MCGIGSNTSSSFLRCGAANTVDIHALISWLIPEEPSSFAWPSFKSAHISHRGMPFTQEDINILWSSDTRIDTPLSTEATKMGDNLCVLSVAALGVGVDSLVGSG